MVVFFSLLQYFLRNILRIQSILQSLTANRVHHLDSPPSHCARSPQGRGVFCFLPLDQSSPLGGGRPGLSSHVPMASDCGRLSVRAPVGTSISLRGNRLRGLVLQSWPCCHLRPRQAQSRQRQMGSERKLSEGLLSLTFHQPLWCRALFIQGNGEVVLVSEILSGRKSPLAHTLHIEGGVLGCIAGA